MKALSPQSLEAINAIAEIVAAKVLENLQAPPKSIVPVPEAMALTGHKSPSAFYRWTKARRVKPIQRGRYSVRRLQVALGTGGHP